MTESSSLENPLPAIRERLVRLSFVLPESQDTWLRTPHPRFRSHWGWALLSPLEAVELDRGDDVIAFLDRVLVECKKK